MAATKAMDNRLDTHTDHCKFPTSVSTSQWFFKQDALPFFAVYQVQRVHAVQRTMLNQMCFEPVHCHIWLPHIATLVLINFVEICQIG